MKLFLIKHIIVIVLLSSLGGCLERIDNIKNESESRLIVQSIITNEKGPYFVLLTKTNPTHKEAMQGYNSTDSEVTDAIVNISDSRGNSEVLSKLEFLPKNDTAYTEESVQVFYMDYDGKRHIISSDSNAYQNIYYTKAIDGIEGNTYNLDIEWNGKTYSASETMLEAPEVDSLTFNKRITKESVIVTDKPTLHFKNPSGKNYYLLEYIDLNEQGGSKITSKSVNLFWYNRIHHYGWFYTVIDDKLLPEPYVNNLKIKIGTSTYNNKWPTIGHNEYVKEMTIGMSSINKNTYLYYKSLQQQLTSKGGAFHPTSSKSINNVNNGALGYFRVSAITRISGRIDE